MCGRKTLTKDIASIIKEMDIEEWEAHDYKPNYNVAPTQFSPVIINKDSNRVAKMMKWGLIPTWSKNQNISSKMINARLETLLEKPSFNSLVNRNRCVVLADGYYEWDKHNSQPYYITHHNKKILPLAGLWTEWEAPNLTTVLSYTVVTTTPTKNIAHIHNRMPVVLEKQNIEKWINCKDHSIFNCLKKIQLKKTTLQFYPVSNTVNSIKNNSIECIEPKISQNTINLFSKKIK